MMRHLFDIVDLSVEEIDELIEVANDIIINPQSYNEDAKIKNWQPCFLNRQHVQGSALRLQ